MNNEFMKKQKKGIAMTMASAMAVVTAFSGCPAQMAKAADTPAADITWDAGNEELTVDLGSADTLYYTNSTVGKTIKLPAAAKYDAVEDGGDLDEDESKDGSITLDMSWLPASDQYLFLSTDSEAIETAAQKVGSKTTDEQKKEIAEAKKKVKIIKIKKAPVLAGKFFGQIDATSKVGKVTITSGAAIKLTEGAFGLTYKDGKDATLITEEQKENIQYKKSENAGWKQLKDSKISTKQLATKGATFQFKYVPKTADIVAATVADAEESEDIDKTINTFDRTSKAVKVKLVAKSSAPKVKTDNKKDIFKLPKGCEYQIKSVATTGSAIEIDKAVWIKNDTTKEKQISYYDLENGKGTKIGLQTGKIVVKVRKSATAKAVASKVSEVTIKAEAETKDAAIQTASEVYDPMTNKDNADLHITYATPYSVTGSGIKLSNTTTGCAYEYALVSIEDNDIKGIGEATTGTLDKAQNAFTDPKAKTGLVAVKWSKVAAAKEKNGITTVGKSTIALSKYFDKKTGKFKKADYVILYRKSCDTRSEIKYQKINTGETASDIVIPALTQELVFTAKDGTATATSGAIKVATGSGIEIGTVQLENRTTVGKYKAAAKLFTDEACTTKAPSGNSAALVQDNEKATVKITAKKAGTYYVQLTYEGAKTVVEVVVEGSAQ